jgi:hypothetical protein
VLSLIWKEWHEQSWKLGFGSIVLAALALVGLRARIIADETMILWVCFVGFGLLPVLASTGLVPPERSEGSLESLLALPVAPWRILLAKTLMGLLLCVGPMFIAAVVSLLTAADREMTVGEMLFLYTRSTLCAMALFVWMFALTIHLPNETRAGLIALGILLFFIVAELAEQYSYWALVASPLGFLRISTDENFKTPPFAAVFACQFVFAVALWSWALRQFAKSEG